MVIGIDASRANLAERTGTEWYALEIIRSLVRRGTADQFILYVQSEPLAELRDLGPRVQIRVLRWPPRLLWSQLRLSWEMLWHRPEVLFIPSHTLPLIHPRRTVVAIHDLGFEYDSRLYENERIGGRLLGPAVRLLTLGRYRNSELDYHRWSARFAIRSAEQIITISNFTKQDLVRRYHADPDRITVQYLGYDRQIFTRSSKQSIDLEIDRFNIKKPYIIYTGRLERKKNISSLIKVLAKVRQNCDVSLVLIGKPGYGWNEAQDLIRTHGLADAVYALGWQPRSVQVALLSGAACFLFLSRFEGFGLPLVEAFAVGTPVIASTAAAIPEITGNAALLVDPDDITGAAQAVEATITDQSIRKELIKRGTERLAAFSWEAAAETTLTLLTRPGP